MATPKCPKCESVFFEIKTASPKNSNYKIQFVNCSSCGCVVGALEFYNTGALLHTLAKQLGVKI